MPATITHAYFVKDVYDTLPEYIKKSVNLQRCMTFGQNTDSLIFYNLLSILPGKNIRKFQKTFHSNNTQEFFLNVIRYIKDNEINDSDTYSFLIGFICHFALDSTIHPYIIYKSGKMRKHDSSTYKYNNRHAYMEAFIDMDMVKRRRKCNPYKFNFNKFICDTSPFSDSLNKTIDYSFFNTFKLENMSSIYYKSLKQMKFALNLCRKDSYGIKKSIYKFIDFLTPKGIFKFEAVSYHVDLEDKNNFLNNNHTMWRNPTTYDMTSNESFIDLYTKSYRLAKILICASFDYFNNKDIDLEQVFTNNSYITGLDCNLKKELKYFEF